MIVSGGEYVYPTEVESVLTEHPAVAQAAFIGVPSERWGESPYAVIVKTPDADVTEADLIAFTPYRMAHYKCLVGVAFV